MQYQAPAKDIQFLLFDVLGADTLHELERYSDATPDIITAVIEEAGRLAAEVLQPINKIGDQQGCQYDPQSHAVTTPDGFKEAYQQFSAGGWASLDAPTEFGGQGLPRTLKFIVDEMVCSTNMSLGMYAGLTHGAISALHAHGSEELKATYLEKLVSGEWTGTMCLTEPQCGTDLGLIRTTATPRADGTYSIEA
jgi:alkylation response protein AidB-like acyl-CoA dehydrogenase